MMSRRTKLGLSVAIAIMVMFCLWSTESSAWEYAPDAATVGLWHLNEATGTVLTDVSGNGHDGAFVNSPVWEPLGAYGSALKMSLNAGDLIPDYVSVPDADALDLQGPFTIEFWMHDATPGRMPLAKRTAGQVDGYYFYQYGSDGTIAFFANDAIWLHSTTTWVGSDHGPTTEGAWEHVAVTWDGLTARLYVNFVEEDSTERYLGPLANTTPLAFGSDTAEVYPYYGIMDEIRILDVARIPRDLPVDLGQGWTLFASGVETPFYWGYAQIDRAGALYSVAEAETQGWIENNVYYFDPVSQEFGFTPSGDTYLRWYRGYWIWSNEIGLQLVVPQ